MSLPEQGRACEVQLEPGLFIPSTYFLSTLVMRRKGPRGLGVLLSHSAGDSR